MSGSPPMISVITPVLNRKDSIGRALASVARQRYPAVEHLIIDGGSTDGTLEVIAAFQKQNPAIRYISEKDNGVYSAMNKGLSLCKGDWIFFLGADDELADECLLDTIFNEGWLDKEHVLYGNVMIRGSAGWANADKIYDGVFDLQKLYRKNICHQAILYPRSVIDRIGLYNTKYRITADWDYNLHCWSRYEFCYIDKIFAHFQAGGTSSEPADQEFLDDLPGNIIRYFQVDPTHPMHDFPESDFYYPVSQYRNRTLTEKISQLEKQIITLNENQSVQKPVRTSHKCSNNPDQSDNIKSYPLITIVTPNLNQGNFIERTIRSVVDQGYPNLEYIIMDGGSNDESVEIITRYQAHISHWESGPDKGLYDALQKGFRISTGEIMGWINADDVLLSNSLFTIAEIFSLSPDIQWIQGYPAVIDEQDRLVYSRQPVFEPAHFLGKHYHDGRFIQQESTLWRRGLWNLAGGNIPGQYKFAGDFALWMQFFRYAPLHITNALLGAFRTRKDNQLSRNHFQEYLTECDMIIDDICQQSSELKEGSWLINYNFSTQRFCPEDIHGIK